MDSIYHAALTALFLIAAFQSAQTAQGQSASCKPAPPDVPGPFHKPGAPERSSVGKGYILSALSDHLRLLACEACPD